MKVSDLKVLRSGSMGPVFPATALLLPIDSPHPQPPPQGHTKDCDPNPESTPLVSAFMASSLPSLEIFPRERSFPREKCHVYPDFRDGISSEQPLQDGQKGASPAAKAL